MKQIWKYPLEETDQQIILMPAGSKILHLAVQYEVACIWAEVYLEAPMEHRKFYFVGTGHPMPLEPTHLEYLGTVVMHEGRLVWHIYEAKKGMLRLPETEEDKEKRRRGL